MSGTSAVANAISGGFERVDIDGQEYLAHDVVAQREGVYYYPDPSGGIQREFVPAEELKDSIEDIDETPVLIEHPDAPEKTPKLTSNPRANYDEVGMWRDIRPTDDEDGIAGRVFIRLNEVGEYDNALVKYINQVAQFGIGEVSTGYNISKAESTSGRHNGSAYDAIQRGLNLDHLALLPDDEGDCSVEDGCGLGRANESDGNLIRTNNHFPDEMADDVNSEDTPEDTRFGSEGVSTEEIKDSQFKEIGKSVISAIPGLRNFDPIETVTMDDEKRIDELVEMHGFTRENIAALEGTTCLTRIHKAVVEQSGESKNNMEGNGDNPEGDNGEENEGGDDSVFTEEQEEQLNQMFSDNVPTAEDIADEIDVTPEPDDVVQQVEEARAHEKNVQMVAASDELPHIDEERAQRMNEDVVADLAEDLDDEGSASDRSNFAGRPSGGSFDASEYEPEDNDGAEIPAGGSGFLEGDE